MAGTLKFRERRQQKKREGRAQRCDAIIIAYGSLHRGLAQLERRQDIVRLAVVSLTQV